MKILKQLLIQMLRNLLLKEKIRIQMKLKLEKPKINSKENQCKRKKRQADGKKQLLVRKMSRKLRENLKKMILKSKINPLLKTHKNKLQIKINNSNTISRKIKEDNNKTIIIINNKLPIRKTTTIISIEQLIMSSKESSQLKEF